VGVFLWRTVAVAIVDRRPQQVTARGLILNNPHRKRWGFFFGGPLLLRS
jgi:hypothetical protein